MAIKHLPYPPVLTSFHPLLPAVAGQRWQKEDEKQDWILSCLMLKQEGWEIPYLLKKSSKIDHESLCK